MTDTAPMTDDALVDLLLRLVTHPAIRASDTVVLPNALRAAADRIRDISAARAALSQPARGTN